MGLRVCTGIPGLSRFTNSKARCILRKPSPSWTTFPTWGRVPAILHYLFFLGKLHLSRRIFEWGTQISQERTQKHDTPNHKWKHTCASIEFIVKLSHCVYIYKSLMAQFSIEIVYLQNTCLKYKILKEFTAVCYPYKEIQDSQQT